MDKLIRRYTRRFRQTGEGGDAIRLANLVSRLESVNPIDITEYEMLCITDYFSEEELSWMSFNYFMSGRMDQRNAVMIDLEGINIKELQQRPYLSDLSVRLESSINNNADYVLFRALDEYSVFETQTIASLPLLLDKDDRGLILNMFSNINNFERMGIYPSFPRYLIDLEQARSVKTTKPKEMPFIYKFLLKLDYDYVLLNEE
jgi:hypothetical protein